MYGTQSAATDIGINHSIQPVSSEVDTFVDEVLKHLFDKFAPYQTAEVAARIRLAVIGHIKQNVAEQEADIKRISINIEELCISINALEREHTVNEAKTMPYDRRNS